MTRLHQAESVTCNRIHLETLKATFYVHSRRFGYFQLKHSALSNLQRNDSHNLWDLPFTCSPASAEFKTQCK